MNSMHITGAGNQRLSARKSYNSGAAVPASSLRTAASTPAWARSAASSSNDRRTTTARPSSARFLYETLYTAWRLPAGNRTTAGDSSEGQSPMTSAAYPPTVSSSSTAPPWQPGPEAGGRVAVSPAAYDHEDAGSQCGIGR